jgi:hypothetical protein
MFDIVMSRTLSFFYCSYKIRSSLQCSSSIDFCFSLVILKKVCILSKTLVLSYLIEGGVRTRSTLYLLIEEIVLIDFFNVEGARYNYKNAVFLIFSIHTSSSSGVSFASNRMTRIVRLIALSLIEIEAIR